MSAGTITLKKLKIEGKLSVGDTVKSSVHGLCKVSQIKSLSAIQLRCIASNLLLNIDGLVLPSDGRLV